MKTRDKSVWVIKLPSKSKVLVKVGDKVKIGDKLATFNKNSIETFNYSDNLSSINDETREQLNSFFKDKIVEKGDLFYNLGFLKGKVYFPSNGLFLGLDELKNLKIERTEVEKKEIISPIEAKVGKIEEGKMVLEFVAKEYKGEGLNGLKAWGEGKIGIVNEIKFLTSDLNNNILFTQNLDKAFLLKAQVIGVKGVVFSDNKEVKEIDGIDLPLLRLDEVTWKDFMKDNLEKNKKMLVNAKMNKLLLVLE